MEALEPEIQWIAVVRRPVKGEKHPLTITYPIDSPKQFDDVVRQFKREGWPYTMFERMRSE